MPSFKALVNFARSERAYYGAVINGEVVESRKTYYEDSLQYHAQVDKDTRAITTVFLKCPKLKAKGNHNLEENTGDENCDTVMAFRVIDGGLYQNSIITNDPTGSTTRRVNGRSVCIPGGDCGCKDITKTEARIVCEFENRLMAYASEFGVKTVCMNGGGDSVEKQVMPNLRGKGTMKFAKGWHLSTMASKYR